MTVHRQAGLGDISLRPQQRVVSLALSGSPRAGRVWGCVFGQGQKNLSGRRILWECT